MKVMKFLKAFLVCSTLSIVIVDPYSKDSTGRYEKEAIFWQILLWIMAAMLYIQLSAVGWWLYQRVSIVSLPISYMDTVVNNKGIPAYRVDKKLASSNHILYN